MKISTLTLCACAVFGAVMITPALQAVTVNYNFVVSSGPTGGGTFTATASFDNSLFGAGFVTQNPLAFTATLSGNSVSGNNRTWSLNEITFSQFALSSTGVLTYNALQATDSGGGAGASLNGGPTGFSAPVTIGGAWVQVTTSVPDSGPGLAAPLALAAVAAFAHRLRRKNRLAV